MQEFNAKRQALFACLDDASKDLKGTALDQTKAYIDGQLMNYRHLQGDPESEDFKLKRLRGKESIFKKPELPIGRCLKPRKTPDYQINPHKWKKYSLSDVDISDQTNSSAALSFLREMEAQRESSSEVPDEAPGTKIEFKKKSKLQRNLKKLQEEEVDDLELDKPQLKGSKLVMPEYVIGQRATKPKRSQAKDTQNRAAAGKLQLSHLEEVDE